MRYTSSIMTLTQNYRLLSKTEVDTTTFSVRPLKAIIEESYFPSIDGSDSDGIY